MPNFRDINNIGQLEREFDAIKRFLESEGGVVRVMWGRPEVTG